MGLFTGIANTVQQVRPARRQTALRNKTRFGCEELEARRLMSCGMDLMDSPAMMAEEMAVLNLVMPDMATNVAIHNGNWNSASTWKDGIIPNANANVLISEGVTVTFDAAYTPALHWLRVDGTLQFATGQNTSLLVDTVVESDTGHWIMGTAADPIHQGVHATVTFADLGAIDTVWDPSQFSRGFIALGSVDIHGAQTTAYAALSVGAHLGDTTLSLAQIPVNWKVGDDLILTGTNPSATEDEKLKILGIQGNVVTVSPLAFNHVAPAGASVYVTDVTRNVVFQSQNANDLGRRGHFMIMHSCDVDVEYAAYVGLGRTDKSRVIDDVINVNSDGSLTAGGGTNIRGRYAFHIHHGGICPDDPAATVIGNVVLGSPGWGFVNHMSNVNFISNVAYNVVGAGFVTEAGNEIGSFRGNLALYEKGSNLTAGREFRQDWGYRGVGFWFQSPGAEVTNNVAVGAARSGFAYYPVAMFEAGLGRAKFLSANLADPSIANGAETIGVPNTPIRKFDGNQAYANYVGVETYAHMLHTPTPNVRSVLENSTIWAVGGEGLSLNYSAHMTLRNINVIGSFTKLVRQGININTLAEDFVFENVRVEGFMSGLQIPSFGKISIIGGYFNNLRSIDILNARDNNRYVNIQNVTFGTLPNATWAKSQIHINVQIFYAGQGVKSLFMGQGTILYNGQYLYALEQAATYVPFPATGSWPGVPSALIGKTNSQLWSQYGLSVGGVMAPSGSVAKAGIRGVIGSYVAPLPTLTLLSAETASVLTDYKLVYKTWLGQTVTEAATDSPIKLQLGWNVITRIIGGRPRSFLVFGK